MPRLNAAAFVSFVPIALLAVASAASAQGIVGTALFQAPGSSPGPAARAATNISVGIIDFGAVTQKSKVGKAALFQLQALQDRKTGELKVLDTRLQGLRAQRQTQATIVTPAALATLDRDIEKVARDLQHAQEEANVELQDLRNQLMEDLQKKVGIVVEQVAKEKGVAVVLEASATVFFSQTIDLSDEVITRLDKES